jgi:hypothetical protein
MPLCASHAEGDCRLSSQPVLVSWIDNTRNDLTSSHYLLPSVTWSVSHCTTCRIIEECEKAYKIPQLISRKLKSSHRCIFPKLRAQVHCFSSQFNFLPTLHPSFIQVAIIEGIGIPIKNIPFVLWGMKHLVWDRGGNVSPSDGRRLRALNSLTRSVQGNIVAMPREFVGTFMFLLLALGGT